MSLYDFFIDRHQAQLELSGVPKIFWPTVFEKLEKQIFDAGLVFEIAKIDYSESIKDIYDPDYKLFVSVKDELSCDDPNNIFLIDHAWTYDVKCAKKHLCEVEGLLDRLCNLMCYNNKNIDNEKDEERLINDKIEFVLSEMWRYNQSFALSMGTVEEKIPIWYIMDEVGSAINHSDKPNFRTVPFLYLNEGATYTLLFPINNVKCDEEVTRDFVENLTSDSNTRRALLLPWIETDFINENFVQEEPDENYFLSGRIIESLPEKFKTVELLNRNTGEKKLKVFTDYRIIIDYLTDPLFELVGEEEKADIIWSINHIRDYKSLNEKYPHVFVNQFPFENVLTVKDLLSIVARRAVKNDKLYDCQTLDTYPLWLPTTYNLNTELVKFVSYFKNREVKNLDNHWICKPWNLARGLDIHVTKNLFHIVRLPTTGPKIIQKYISSPVLYTRSDIGKVKFDIRYVILLKSVDPLQVYVYTNFFLRFANKKFALNRLNDYEQHFTVMNYSEETSLYHVKCADFIPQWNNMYPNYDWQKYVEPKIFQMTRELFEAATSATSPKGIAANPQSRALYAIDMMLEWKENEMQPILLEVNFSPDNRRACQYYPEFYNDIFKLLFLDIENPKVFHYI